MNHFYIRLVNTLSIEERDARGATIATPHLSPGCWRLLSCLAIKGYGVGTPRDALAEMLWPDSSPEKAKSRLSSSIYRLRQALNDNAKQTDAAPLVQEECNAVSLVADGMVVIDIHQLDIHVSAIRSKRIESLTTETMSALERELHNCGGALARELETPCFDIDRYHYEDNRQFALEALMRFFRATGQADKSISAAKKLNSLDPLREDVYATLIALYGEKGLRGHAVEQFSRCKDVLSNELGLTPNAEVIASYHRCLKSSVPLVAEQRETVDLDKLVSEITLSIELLQSQIQSLVQFRD